MDVVQGKERVTFHFRLHMVWQSNVVLIGRILFSEQKCAVSYLEKAMFTIPKWKHCNDRKWFTELMQIKEK